jgi:hypothetical protein
MGQLHHFGSISNRAPGARPIQLIREIDKRWRGLGLIKALESSLEALRNYLGVSLVSGAVAKRLFATAAPGQERLVDLLSAPSSTARHDDLDIMLQFLPRVFQVLRFRASDKRIRPAVHSTPTAVEDLNTAVARCAQAYLISERQAYLQRHSMAQELRKFFFGLGHWPYRKKLFGLMEDDIKDWDAAQARAGNRARQRRYRKKHAVLRYT